MATRYAYNTSPGPVVIDAQGHTIAGRSWANVHDDTAEVRHAFTLGQLVWHDDQPAPDAAPAAIAAWQQPAPNPQPTTSEETAQ